MDQDRSRIATWMWYRSATARRDVTAFLAKDSGHAVIRETGVCCPGEESRWAMLIDLVIDSSPHW